VAVNKTPLQQTVVPLLRPHSAFAGQPAESRNRESRAWLEVAVGEGGKTVLRDLFHSQPLRLLFPRPEEDDVFHAVLACVSGGILGGDRLRAEIHAGADAKAMVIGQAAEKIYRSLGPDSEIQNSLNVENGAWLEWLPQETILFDQARLRRRTIAKIHRGGRLLAGEILVFGRTARGESLRRGLVHDGWELRNGDGTLVWKDALHMDGDLGALLADPACFGGARAYGTIICANGGARALLGPVRDLLAGCAGAALRAGATLVRETMLIRFLGRNTLELRSAYAAAWAFLRHEIMGLPRRMPALWKV
jgi:urease accessory protein